MAGSFGRNLYEFDENSFVFNEKEISVKAFAKVNLYLKIVGKRPCGMHDLKTLMGRISLHDRLKIAQCADLRVSCPGLEDLAMQDNLAYIAAKRLLLKARPGFGACIELEKNIPPGSGMGGGSSDAAAVLLGLNRLLGDKALDRYALYDIAKGIGADVPFFLGANDDPPGWNGAFCTGIGDVINPVLLPFVPMVVAMPKFSISTAWAYERFDEMAPQGISGGDNPIFDRGLEALAGLLFNDLEEPVAKSHPQIRAMVKGFKRSTALNAAMTGSGSAVFAVCKGREHSKYVRDLFLADYGSLVKEIFITEIEGESC